MVHIYYHIYAIEGVDSIIDEQLNLIKKHFDFPYILNVGISIAKNDVSITDILNKVKPYIRDIRAMGNEFTTLDLIQKDKQKFGDSDYILYIHTKGASRINDDEFYNYKCIEDWRHYMNYFNIEKVKSVFKIFEKTEYNTSGCHFMPNRPHYSGNFWWAKSTYIKTINLDGVNLSNRFNAELSYIQRGIDWKPYSQHDINRNLYKQEVKRNEYAK